jgi:hypothetical protein
MSSIHDYFSMGERRADLFALADLIPDRDMTEVVRLERDPDGALAWMRRQIEIFAAWPADRVEDRARLRWSLFFGDEALQ